MYCSSVSPVVRYIIKWPNWKHIQSYIHRVNSAGDRDSGAIWCLDWQMWGARVQWFSTVSRVIVFNVVCFIHVYMSSDVVGKRPWSQVLHHLVTYHTHASVTKQYHIISYHI